VALLGTFGESAFYSTIDTPAWFAGRRFLLDRQQLYNCAMPDLSYRQAGLILGTGNTDASEQQIQDLQRDLRRLGYLRVGIDGILGPGTTFAIKALQHDLLHNDGGSGAEDGQAPVRVIDFNRGITEVTGEVDQIMVECISDMLDDPRFVQLPSTLNPVEENQKIRTELRNMPAGTVPTLFLLAILQQESDLKHFHEPLGKDEDAFIVIGLDTPGENFVITSRGYGAGQYTLFHHPPASEEVTDFMLDPVKNVQRASKELRDKFDRFLNGSTAGTSADDRVAEVGPVPLRVCKFAADDPRFLVACSQCVLDAGVEDIVAGTTPLFPGSALAYEPTGLRHDFTQYSGVPVRKEIGCDWPYAVRRYNGSGMDSYHYQAQVLLNLKAL
jgi:hypothetical protein